VIPMSFERAQSTFNWWRKAFLLAGYSRQNAGGGEVLIKKVASMRGGGDPL